MHILNNYFQNIFVIAHPESHRFLTFNQRWKGLNYTLARFVKKNEESWSEDGKANHIFNNLPNKIPLKDPLSNGQTACALAHILIYDEIISKNLTNTIILEDDSVFNNISNLEIALKSDYDILALFTANCDLLTSPQSAEPFTEHYSRAGTSAYLIRDAKVAEKLYNSQLKNMDTADGVIMRSDMKIYAVYPPVCSCDESPSLIVNEFY